MAFHCLADSNDLCLFVLPHRSYRLTIQLPVFSGLPLECSLPTPLHDVRGFLRQKALGRSRCTWQTAFRQLQDFGVEVSPEFLRIFGIVMFTETFPTSCWYSWATLSSRRPRISSRTLLDGVISQDVIRILSVAREVFGRSRQTRRPERTCSSVSSDRLGVYGSSLSLQHRY